MAAMSNLLGQRVRHAAFGQGTVRAVIANGGIYRVYFEAIGGTELVSAESCAPVSQQAAALPAQQARPIATSTGTGAPVHRPAGGTRERQTIECLRQGLPPPGQLRDWTVGQHKARSDLQAILQRAAQGKGEVVFATAPYGQGKTHLGRLAVEFATELGMATMQVELDGKGRSLADGAKLTEEMFASLQLPLTGSDRDGTVPGLGTLLRRAAFPLASNGLPLGLEIFSEFLEFPSRWIESDEVIVTLERYLSGALNRTDAAGALRPFLGHSIALPSLKMDWGRQEHRRQAQGDQILRIISLSKIAGASGTLIVLDELDQDYNGLDHPKKNKMLGELDRVAKSGPVVVLLLARTLTVSNAREIPLDKVLSEADLATLVNKAIDTFALVYPHPGLAVGRPAFFQALNHRFDAEYANRGWGPRFFVRATIEACEGVRARDLRSMADVRIQ